MAKKNKPHQSPRKQSRVELASFDQRRTEDATGEDATAMETIRDSSLQPGCCRPHLDLLRYGCSLDTHVLARRASACCANRSYRALSHCKPIRSLCSHDAASLRDRIPGIERRRALGLLSLPLQTAGVERASAHLRSLSTTLRLESLVRITGLMAAVPNRSTD